MKDEEKPEDLAGEDNAPSIFDDLAKLKADSAVSAPPADEGKPPVSGSRWKRHGTFVPREWEVRLRRATRVSTYHLAHELLYRHWHAEQDQFGPGGGVVVVSGELTEAVGISMRSMGNALDQLEQLGLIAVIRKQRRSPRAFLLHVPIKTSRRRRA